jgi:hypothetical protein
MSWHANPSIADRYTSTLGSRMLDPVVSLAFALQASPGAYALLLGSGVSRSAQVPTGWEVVLDLTRRLAIAEGETATEDPVGWYCERFGAAPGYSDLLDSLARTPAERQALLREYFEPTDEEREQGVKRPTAAHRAIARLVRDGIIRVIITTNFDRLLETAIEDEGVTPIVIATPDMAAGAPPLAHSAVTIVKVHGDYLDTRIRNTPTELAAYDNATNRILDRVFDEYGLIVCGWSGEWDQALRDAIARCASHRYSTYWARHARPRPASSLTSRPRGGRFSLRSPTRTRCSRRSRNVSPRSATSTLAIRHPPRWQSRP